MLSEERTLEKFGYTAESLSVKSKKKVVVICDYCGNEVNKSKDRFTVGREFVQKDACMKCRYLKNKEVCLVKYGMENIFSTDHIKKKIEETNVNKYGGKSPMSNKEVRAKSDKTKLDKYGTINLMSLQENKDKVKATMLEKYGVENASQSPELQAKKSRTWIEKYGVDHPFKNPEIKQRIADTTKARYGVENVFANKEIQEKIKQSNRSKLGCDYPLQAESVKQKSKETCLEKYGTEYASQSEIVKEKIVQTNIERYGGPTPMSSEEVLNKCLEARLEKYGTLAPQNLGKTQQEIQEWLKDLGFEFAPDVNILKGKEIDLYNAELKLGIEYCGLYWHHENSPQPRKSRYHYNKYLHCKLQDIRLITIFEDEWIFRQEQVKGFIKSVLGQNNTYYARECEIKEVDKKMGKEFINKYHIQSLKKFAKLYLGLYHHDELVGIMSFSDHHRQGNKGTLVLNRMCFKSEITVVGGASKLFTRAVQWAIGHKYSKIISWSDNRWSTGNVYLTMGFTLDKELMPDYSYVDLNNSQKIRKSKQEMKKSNIGCPTDVSERDFALQLGFSRIWDCGKKRFVYNLT